MEQNFIENEIMVLSKQTMDLFLSQENCSEIISVYLFYYYTAKWQKTNQPKATDGYVMKGLHLGKIKFQKAKNFLLEHNLISQVTTRNSKGNVDGWYIKMNYIWKSETVQNVMEPLGSEPTSGSQPTNALSADNINASKANIITQPSVLDTGKLPDNRGSSYINRVLSIYNDLFTSVMGYKPTVNFGLWGKNLKELLLVKTELQVAALLITFFNWHGMNGQDGFEYQKVLDSAFNTSWFFKSVNVYEGYLRNVFGLKLDDEEAVRAFVGKTMVSL